MCSLCLSASWRPQHVGSALPKAGLDMQTEVHSSPQSCVRTAKRAKLLLALILVNVLSFLILICVILQSLIERHERVAGVYHVFTVSPLIGTFDPDSSVQSLWNHS